MRGAWAVAAAAFAVLGAALTATVLARGGGLGVLHVAVTPLPGWSFGVTGLLACLRRRWRRVGVLLLAVGLAWFVHLLDWTHVPALVAVCVPVRNAYAAAFAHLVLAFPSGRLARGWSRALAVAAYLDVVGLQLVAAAVGGTGSAAAWAAGGPTPAAGWYDLEAVTGVALAGLVVAVLARRARHAGQRPPAATWTAALVAFAALVANLVTARFAPDLALLPWVLFSAAFAAVPFAFLASLLGLRLRRAGVAGLMVRLGRVGDPAELRDALADALRDPSLELAFWVPDRDGYVDAEGRGVALPGAGGPRMATPVDRDGRRVGALVHDPASGRERELVDAVAAAAGFALQNIQLQAELRARLAELRASRARLVDAAAAERRRIERNLHDGAQQRLVSVAFALGLAHARLAADPTGAGVVLAEARAALGQALDDLRRLSQGIHPGVLAERGLRAAVAELVWATPVPVRLHWHASERLPEPVESAGYYVVAEALANAVKHAQATAVRVEVAETAGRVAIEIGDDGVGGAGPAGGTGLRGLRDRVEALGGELTVHSPVRGGTTVRAELPCGR